ncbi:Rgp1-domain-containing protein [Multifurca ochricompacta]|uniref:Rgp1-domain-containing protein n=1 Tax=Multifurca ochricompacta TaxID=376703 RepID=A0AAD4MC84_9AGAM|nr:Rgp1-domain-containing protein [Multifurca ochricompacta]
MSAVQDTDTALRIVVTPSQSSYFAGEPLTVTITIANTRSPQAQVAPPRSTHKRNAHSVSSARLARPPTSPGLPRNSLTAPLRPALPKSSAPTRKGLIGTTPPDNGPPDESSSSEKRISTRSLSVDIPSHELPNSFYDDTKVSLLRAARRAGQSSPRTPSPLARTSSAPVPPNHPHARKASIVEGPVHIPQSASASSFALSLDPIAESMSPIPPTPTFPSPAPTPSPFTSPHAIDPFKSPSHAYPLPTSTQHPPQALLGNGHPSSFRSLPSENTELVLYAYVHLTGSLFLLPPPSLARPSALAALQRHKRGPRGGGSMNIGVASPPPSRGHERRSASIAGSLWGLLSSPASAVLSPGHRARVPSQGGVPVSPNTRIFASAGAKVASHGKESIGLGLGGVGLGMGVIQEGEDWDPDQPMPVFEVPPSMLAVDLSLGPGEERSYTYTVNLPSNLPPTYRGRTIRFSYNLSIGACRATEGTPSSQSRVMKVPIRVYNHVSVDQPSRWYDLLLGSAEQGGRLEEKIEEKPRGLLKSSSQASPPSASQGSVSDLRTCALLLLEPDSAALPALPAARAMMDDQESHESESGLTGCREAVEVLTRVSRKVSYDVNKDGIKVAVLTFMKSAWRLGETVLGVVELNDREGSARILKLSAMLEAHETLPSEIAAPPDARHMSYMRRVHAEHHASFMPQTLRTTFALDIPSDAAPAFRLSLGGASSEGGLAWKVRLCLLVAVATPDAQVRCMEREGPRGQWGSTWIATDTLAPRERLSKIVEPASAPHAPKARSTSPATRSWASFLASTFLSVSEGAFHDGDEEPPDEKDRDELAEGEADLGGGEEGWRELAVETVECEVPVMVWPGNTAFRPEDVVFDV